MLNAFKNLLIQDTQPPPAGAQPTGGMLCPMCMQAVESFPASKGADDSMLPRCPRCEQDVPEFYVRDYGAFPPVVFSIIGFRSHGKSVFLGSLFHELDSASVSRSAKEWKGFSYSAPDEASMEHVREAQELLEQRKLPDPTDRAFFRPAILRMKNLPKFGDRQLLSYDTSGELLQQSSFIKGHHTGYISRVPTVLLLVSWKQKDDAERSRHGLNDLLTIYRQAVAALGADTKSQNLLVVLTKGDRLVQEPGVPESVREFLHPSAKAGARRVHEAGDDEHFGRLDEMSEDIEEWFEQHRKFSVFAREARDEFRSVEYCAVTATGMEPELVDVTDDSGQTIKEKRLPHDIAPRGVLSALLWAVRLQSPDAAAENKRRSWIEAATGQLQSEAARAFCVKHGLEEDRQRALERLGLGRIHAANRLMAEVRAKHNR